MMRKKCQEFGGVLAETVRFHRHLKDGGREILVYVVPDTILDILEFAI
jgi:hypothetical protein